jgi:hypothetical protein
MYKNIKYNNLAIEFSYDSTRVQYRNHHVTGMYYSVNQRRMHHYGAQQVWAELRLDGCGKKLFNQRVSYLREGELMDGNLRDAGSL